MGDDEKLPHTITLWGGPSDGQTYDVDDDILTAGWPLPQYLLHGVGEAPWVIDGQLKGQMNPPVIGHYVRRDDDPLHWDWRPL